jgi:4-oxalocrotonate tautomerase
MPTLQLQISPPQTASRYRALADALTQITHTQLGKRSEVTAVVIDELPTTRWYVGGHPVQCPTALLEISITQGTNSIEQKSAFIATAFAELERQLGNEKGLEPASYVIVREVPATDWGYHGHTQASRRQGAAAF